MHPTYRARSAFSLVELSIVLVILGLLVGGVLAGQSLIRAAELRAVVTEYNRYAAATQSFRDKYFALPGDMTNATAFWGSSSNCPGAYNQGTTDGTTCNGNGDGKVFYTGAYTSPTTNEVFRYWQQLANANMIEGTFSGVTTSTTGYYIGSDASNAPISKLKSALWGAEYFPNASSLHLSTVYAQDFTLAVIFGGIVAQSIPIGPILKPEEAWNLDTKLDDGMPGTGMALSRVGNSCTSGSTKTDLTAVYSVSNSSANCYMVFALIR